MVWGGPGFLQKCSLHQQHQQGFSDGSLSILVRETGYFLPKPRCDITEITDMKRVSKNDWKPQCSRTLVIVIRISAINVQMEEKISIFSRERKTLWNLPILTTLLVWCSQFDFKLLETLVKYLFLLTFPQSREWACKSLTQMCFRKAVHILVITMVLGSNDPHWFPCNLSKNTWRIANIQVKEKPVVAFQRLKYEIHETYEMNVHLKLKTHLLNHPMKMNWFTVW